MIALYLLGYLLFCVSAISVWGFVYRPKARGANNRGAWSNHEIVKFAMIQGVAWPAFSVAYILIVVLFGVLWVLNEGFDLGARQVANLLPDEHYPGFRRKQQQQDHRYDYR